MHSRPPLRAVVGATLLLVLAIASVSIREDAASAATRRPNVVIVLSDDQRWDKITPSYTPHIWDRIVDTPADTLHPDATSVAFANAFVPNPLCCPSRTSILTGRYSHSTGVWGNRGAYGGFEAFDDKHTMAVDFNDAGYRTAMIGKYLNGYIAGRTRYVPPGWDRWFATGPGYYDYGATSAWRLRTSTTPGWDGRRTHFGVRPNRDYITNVVRERAIGFIEKSVAADEPFFLLFSAYAPHGPAIPDPRDIDRFAGEEDFAFAVSPVSSALEAAYSLDRAVGKVLNALPSNTIVVYLSDNGYLWGEHGLTGKAEPYNESIRVPMAVASLNGAFSPTAAPTDIVLNVDLRPTLTRAAGVAMLTRAEGLDLESATYAPRSRFVLEHKGYHAFCGVRELDWMYARYDDGRELLFHDAVDPGEETNLMPDVDTNPTAASAYARLYDDAVALCDPAPPGYEW
jgi:arylsulfatase A-like enzyme